MLVLTDRNFDDNQLPIPAAMAVGALVLGFFPHNAIPVPAVVGGGGGAVGVAHGFADPAAQAVVTVSGLAGRPQLAGMDEMYQTVRAVVAQG